jgi:site-specific recombinase XerD
MKLKSKQPSEQPRLQPFDSAESAKKGAKPVRGVFQHPPGSGIWWINYFADGVRHREKVGSKGNAIKLYQKRKSDALAGVKLPETFRVKKPVLFSELAADAMVYSKAHKKSYRGDVSNLNSLLPVFGKMKADEITPQSITRYLASRTDLKPASRNRYRSTMSMIFAEGIRNGRVKNNPARLVRLHKENNARVRFLTFDEEDQIRAIILRRCPVHEPDFTIALETGMRLTEQHTLEWSNVNFDRGQIELLETKNGSSRVVSLTEEAVSALKVCLIRRNPKTHRVFLTRYGKPMQNPRAWFELVMAEAVAENPGLSDVTWHVFRHTFISRLVMAGVGLKEVQELAGHKTLSMTNRYAHLSPEHKQKAVQQLSAYRRQEAENRTVVRA